MRIAILSSGDLDDMKGVMNFVQEKSLQMRRYKSLDIVVDNYIIVIQYSKIFRFINKVLGRRLTRMKWCYDENGRKLPEVEKNGVNYRILWVNYGLFDSWMTTKIASRFLNSKEILRACNLLKGYDVITSHNWMCHSIAYHQSLINNIPYIATWHGSDINVYPWSNLKQIPYLRAIMENAAMNFFVSKGLLNKSNELTKTAVKDVLYTGPSSYFFEYTEEKKLWLRDKYNVHTNAIVGLVANIIAIKNVLVLPQIFSKVVNKISPKTVEFWIVGNGDLEEQLIDGLTKEKVEFRMFGKRLPNEIPDILNCMNVSVLPSINEGFPLSVLESRACGVVAVGSNVGGIPESAGINNSFPLDDNFVDQISNRIAEVILNNEKSQPLPIEFSWKSAIQKELNKCKVLYECKRNDI